MLDRVGLPQEIHMTRVLSYNIQSGGTYRTDKLATIIEAARQGTPHMLMGDFNAVAPGESIKTSALLSYFLNPTQAYPKQNSDSAAQAELDLAIRSSIRALEALPGNTFLSAITDSASLLYAPSASLELLDEAGYVDCYRRINPRSPGLTYPSPIPAGRIDFIFASPELAPRLSTSYVVVKAAGVAGYEASDHLPVFAEFAL